VKGIANKAPPTTRIGGQAISSCWHWNLLNCTELFERYCTE